MEILRKIQHCELEILKAVVSLCERHNLRYWLAYGTLLGAVRHHGFIPWDDDIDIYMTVQDLKKFVKYAKEELKDDFFIQCPITEKKTHWMFCKVRKNGTRLLETNEQIRNDFHQGIWIDVFPLVPVSDSRAIQDYQIKNFFRLQKMRGFYPQYSGNHSIKELIKHLYELIVKVSEVLLWKINIMLGQITKSSNYLAIGTEYIAAFPERLRKKERLFISKKMIQETKVYSFEGLLFTSMEDSNKYLTQFYGADYMTPKKNSIHAETYDNCIIPDMVEEDA